MFREKVGMFGENYGTCIRNMPPDVISKKKWYVFQVRFRGLSAGSTTAISDNHNFMGQWLFCGAYAPQNSRKRARTSLEEKVALLEEKSGSFLV